jgi:hypothetical protein
VEAAVKVGLLPALRRKRTVVAPTRPWRYQTPQIDYPDPPVGVDGLTSQQRAHLRWSTDMELTVDEQAWHAAEYQRLLEGGG